MAKPDISALSIVELHELMDDTKKLADRKRVEELKKLVDDLIGKSKAIQVTLADVVKEIKKHDTDSVARKPKASGTGKKEPNPWGKGVAYYNPANKDGEPWVGGTQGPKPGWLVKLIPESMSQADKTAKYSQLAKK